MPAISSAKPMQNLTGESASPKNAGSLAAAGCEEGPAELGLISLGQAMESDCESELMVS